MLLGAASVLTGLLAALGVDGSIPTWRKWTTVVAFAALLVSIFAGIVAVWPRKGKQQSLPAPPDGAVVAGVETYASMNPNEFLMSQCRDAYSTMTTGDYSSIINFRRGVFRLQAAALVIGGALIAINGLVTTIEISPPHKAISKEKVTASQTLASPFIMSSCSHGSAPVTPIPLP